MSFEEAMKYFKPEEQSFLRALYAHGRLRIVGSEDERVPLGVTHVLVLKEGEPPKAIRKRFAD